MYFLMEESRPWIVMKSAKPKTKRNQAHTSKSPKGMGDYYGSGIRQKIGRIRDSYLSNEIKGKDLGKPPRSLA